MLHDFKSYESSDCFSRYEAGEVSGKVSTVIPSEPINEEDMLFEIEEESRILKAIGLNPDVVESQKNDWDTVKQSFRPVPVDEPVSFFFIDA